jgi:hypothetical protein
MQVPMDSSLPPASLLFTECPLLSARRYAAKGDWLLLELAIQEFDMSVSPGCRYSYDLGLVSY